MERNITVVITHSLDEIFSILFVIFWRLFLKLITYFASYGIFKPVKQLSHNSKTIRHYTRYL